MVCLFSFSLSPNRALGFNTPPGGFQGAQRQQRAQQSCYRSAPWICRPITSPGAIREKVVKSGCVCVCVCVFFTSQTSPTWNNKNGWGFKYGVSLVWWVTRAFFWALLKMVHRASASSIFMGCAHIFTISTGAGFLNHPQYHSCH